jgi:hypothetical protein
MFLEEAAVPDHQQRQRRSRAASWVVFLVSTTALAAGCANSSPSDSLDEVSLAVLMTPSLPSHVKLSGVRITGRADDSGGNDAVTSVRFAANLVARTDTFVQAGTEDGHVVLAPRMSLGQVQPVTGTAVAKRGSAGWKATFSFEGDALASFGVPKDQFDGSAIVQGSAEEAALRADQQRRRDQDAFETETRRREAELARQREEELTRQAQRQAAAAADAERARRLEENARLDAQRRAAEASARGAEAGRAEAREQQSAPATAVIQVPVGTEVPVRLSARLNSGAVAVEDRFEAVTTEALSVDGRVAVPAGSIVRGIVSQVSPATRTNRTARMTLSFERLTLPGGESYEMRGTLVEALQGRGIKGELKRIATGGAIGAIIGGILGGAKGAAAGGAIGGGGTVAATEGQEIDLPQGTILRMRLDAPLSVR